MIPKLSWQPFWSWKKKKKVHVWLWTPPGSESVLRHGTRTPAYISNNSWPSVSNVVIVWEQADEKRLCSIQTSPLNMPGSALNKIWEDFSTFCIYTNVQNYCGDRDDQVTAVVASIATRNSLRYVWLCNKDTDDDCAGARWRGEVMMREVARSEQWWVNMYTN
jgi:hypothetical protein